MNDCSNISSFPENSSRLINSQEGTLLSLHPIIPQIDRRPARTRLGSFVCFFERRKRESETAFCFIPLFYYFHFLVFVRFFFLFLEEGDSSRWRRATAKPKLRRWRMIYLLPLLHFHPPFYSPPPPSFPWFCGKRERLREGENEEGGGDEGRQTGERYSLEML